MVVDMCSGSLAYGFWQVFEYWFMWERFTLNLMCSRNVSRILFCAGTEARPVDFSGVVCKSSVGVI